MRWVSQELNRSYELALLYLTMQGLRFKAASMTGASTISVVSALYLGDEPR
jgi:hypothetical protein